ncbi:MAG: transporter substrate-binding domain-containing protein [Paludibacterium sp.]|uniref:substrate-binding periplasmic protein n=1 Tax=Paludibacterium sp. TaxID=1917523 RepID=UPI0025DAA974|nr:transporter substrate-binding domain-containing protein [Paludibacterium sp.]MBV8048777.1 transporter substrate-binding domain-containing protein [Paludibacterium sp.]
MALLTALGLMLGPLSAWAGPRELVLECDHLPPACNTPADGSPGFMIDIGQEALRRAGFSAQVRIVPWKRAMQDAEYHNDTLIVYFARTPEREASFRWIDITNQTTFAFMTKEQAPPVDTLAQAQMLGAIGIRAGSSVRSWLIEHGIAATMLQESTLETMARMLKAGRVPVFFGAPSTFVPLYTKLNGSRPVVGAPLYASDNWLASGLGFPAGDAARIGAAVRAMKADGSITAILAKYGQ